MSPTSALLPGQPIVSIAHTNGEARTDRYTAKQCYHCQGLGHVQADCPTLRISGQAAGGNCYSCGQPGHLARNCPNPNSATQPVVAAPARGGYGGGFRGRGGFQGRGGFNVTTNRAATCYKCGGPNHYARDCQAQAMKCYACGKLVSETSDFRMAITDSNLGSHLSRLHGSQWWPSQRCRQDLLQVRRAWPYLS